MSTRLKVVYDVDDVLWGLNQRVFQRLGLDMAKHITYDIDTNPYFSRETVTKINAEFSNQEVFEQIEFYPGASEIFGIEDLGVDVYIHSNCYSQAVADCKLRQLRQLFPGVDRERIELNLVSKSTNTKRLVDNVLVFIDDSPYNIAKSQALVNIMPTKTYNTSTESENIAKGEDKIMLGDDYRLALPQVLREHAPCIIRVPDLLTVNQTVKYIIELQKEATHGKK